MGVHEIEVEGNAEGEKDEFEAFDRMGEVRPQEEEDARSEEEEANYHQNEVHQEEPYQDEGSSHEER